MGASPRYISITHHTDTAASLAKYNMKRFTELIFRLVDRNKNETLEKSEVTAFIGASRVLGTLPPDLYGLNNKDIVVKLYQRFDLDENGPLDRREFLTLHQSFYYDHCFAASAYKVETMTPLFRAFHMTPHWAVVPGV